MLHNTLVVCIFRLTICHCCTGSVLAPDATTVVMLGRVGGCEYVEVGVGTVVDVVPEVPFGAAGHPYICFVRGSRFCLLSAILRNTL